MVLVGLGILLVSLSFLVYRVPPTTWRSFVRRDEQQKSPQLDLTRDSSDKPSQSRRSPSPPLKLEAIREDRRKDGDTSPLKERPDIRIANGASSVPQFNLDETHIKESSSSGSEKPDNETSNGAARLAMPPPPKSATQTSLSSSSAPTQPSFSMRPPPPKPTSNTLMPPPSVKPSALRPLPKLNGTLSPPPSAASTLRGPPGRTPAAKAGGPAPSTSTQHPSKRPSRKVLLDPGHSPLDWANLIRNPPSPAFLRGADVPPHLIKVTPSQLKGHNGRKGSDAWGTYQGKVYNLTPYLKFHPGGVGELMRGAGKAGEAERLFLEIHPWVNWDGLLGECLVGILVSEDDAARAKGEEDLEAID